MNIRYPIYEGVYRILTLRYIGREFSIIQKGFSWQYETVKTG